MGLNTTEGQNLTNATLLQDKIAAENVVLPVALRVGLTVVLLLTMVVGILGNGAVCLLVYRKSTMRSAINLLVAHLALADILLALVVAPCILTGVLSSSLVTPGPTVCALLAGLQEMLVTLGILILLTISVDRYLIIVRQREKLDSRRARIIIFASWMYAFLANVPPFFGWGPFGSYPGHLQCDVTVVYDAKDTSYLFVNSAATKFIPFAVMCHSCTCIVLKVRRNSMKVKHYPVSISVTQASRTNVPQPRTSLVTSLHSSSPTKKDVLLRTFTLRPFCGGPLCRESPSSNSSLPHRLISPGSSLNSYCELGDQSNGSAELGPPLSSHRSPRKLHHSHRNASVRHGSVKSEHVRNSKLPTTAIEKIKLSTRVNSRRTLSHDSRSKSTSCPTLSSHWDSRSLLFSARNRGDARYGSVKSEHDRSSKPSRTETEKQELSTQDHPWGLLSRQRSAYLHRTVSLAASAPRHFVGSTRRHVLDMSFKTRAFKTILLLSLMLLICWTPYAASVLTASLTSHTDPALLCVLLVLGLTKSAIYPLVYAVRIRKFRAAIRLAFPRTMTCVMLCRHCLSVLAAKRRVDPATAYRCPDTSYEERSVM